MPAVFAYRCQGQGLAAKLLDGIRNIARAAAKVAAHMGRKYRQTELVNLLRQNQISKAAIKRKNIVNGHGARNQNVHVCIGVNRYGWVWMGLDGRESEQMPASKLAPRQRRKSGVKNRYAVARYALPCNICWQAHLEQYRATPLATRRKNGWRRHGSIVGNNAPHDDLPIVVEQIQL